ncbi:MAG: nicotinamide-nucleotide amidase [Pseudonocardiales bacterium]|jgi:PncC family amidohydrolase|nr:nicotinamide-nucleotide amidase [Pseudonocardiales bacterium]
MTNEDAPGAAATGSRRGPDATRPQGNESAEQIAADCLRVLQQREQTVATAESLTAGLISATFAGVPGASAALRGGVTAYATEAKADVLGVTRRVLDEHGAVSAQCAEAMARAVSDLFGSTWGVSATGVAGPDRQEGKPVGTIFVGVAGPAGSGTAGHHLFGGRQQIRAGAVESALRLLRAALTAPG